MDREQLQKMTDPVKDVFLQIEEQMLINIAKRLKKHESLMDKDIHSWQLQQLQELGQLRREHIQLIAQYSGKTQEEVQKMLQKAGYAPVEEMEGILLQGVAAGVLLQPPAMEVSSALGDILAQYQEQAGNTFNLINSTMLQQSERVYTDILNATVGKVLAGTQSAQEARREAVRAWADEGVPALIDRSGKKWSPEAYTSLVLRSMSNNIANDMQFARMEEYGVDLMEVSSHLGARPKCYPWQGKVISRTGQTKGYPTLSETSFGDLDGLRGINCRHVFYPYIPGVSKERYPQYDETRNKSAYENSQKQRYLERRIRKAKREVNMMEAMGDSEGVTQARSKVRERQGDMRTFINNTNRTRRRGREQL